jgi:hypothetical protein
MAHFTTSRGHVLAHAATAIIGGYVFSWGVVSFGIAGLFKAGLEFHDAEAVASMIGLLGFVGVFLWSFAARDVRPVAATLICGGTVMAGAATWVQSTTLSAG